MQFTRVPTATGAILYDPARISLPSHADFDPRWLDQQGRIRGLAKGRGNAWFLAPRQPDEPALVLRHFRRGGLIARWVDDHYVWTGKSATRSFSEFKLLALMSDWTLPAARPVAARYVREGLTYRADLLTVWIEGTRSLAACLTSDVSRLQWWQIGHTLRAFHDAGIDHADLNAHNILLDTDGHVHLVDFDRGRRRSLGRWRARNLQRLKRSLEKLGRAQDPALFHAGWEALQTGYALPRKAPLR